MVKKVLFFLFAVLLFTACGNNPEKSAKDKSTEEISMIDVKTFLSNPDSFVGKEIIISGTTIHVCREGGKRMFIIGEDPDQRLQIKAGEEIPSFAVELEGSDVLVTGVVDELRIDEAYLTEWENELKADNAESEKKIHRGEEGHEHNEGSVDAEYEQINNYRTQLTESGQDHLSFYSIIASKFEEKK
jgi:hypothetical protein